jgi:hypothetical protein
MKICSEKHERERNEWMKSCQNHVRILTNSQRVAEELDAEVKKLRQTIECKNKELVDAMKQSEKEAACPQTELQDSSTQLTEPNPAQNLGDLQNGHRKSIAKSLVRLFVDHAKQAQNKGTMILLPGQTTDAIGLRLGLQVEHAMYRDFWGEAEEPSEGYLEEFVAVQFYLEVNSELRDRLLDGSVLPDALSWMSEDEIRGKFKVMVIVEEEHAVTQMENSNAEHAERIQEATQVESEHQKDHDEHQSAPHSVLSEGYEVKISEQNEEEHQAGGGFIGEKVDDGVGGISSSNEPFTTVLMTNQS